MPQLGPKPKTYKDEIPVKNSAPRTGSEAFGQVPLCGPISILNASSSLWTDQHPECHLSKPHPCNMAQAKLLFSESCVAEVALQHSLFCSADIVFTKSCAATSEKLHCNIETASLHESGAFLPLSCGFQAPTFGHPRLGCAEPNCPSNFQSALNSGFRVGFDLPFLLPLRMNLLQFEFPRTIFGSSETDLGSEEGILKDKLRFSRPIKSYT